MSTPSRDGRLSGGGCDIGGGGGGGTGSGLEDCDGNSIDGRHSGGSCDPFLCDEQQDLGMRIKYRLIDFMNIHSLTIIYLYSRTSNGCRSRWWW